MDRDYEIKRRHNFTRFYITSYGSDNL